MSDVFVNIIYYIRVIQNISDLSDHNGPLNIFKESLKSKQCIRFMDLQGCWANPDGANPDDWGNPDDFLGKSLKLFLTIFL